MYNGKSFLVFSVAFFLTLQLLAQPFNDKQLELAERLHSVAKNMPPELPYIQTNKDIYETGEDLWFKVYMLDAQYLIPSKMSRTLYLQLINEKSRKAVWQEKYEIQNGFTGGHVYLETSLLEGDYFLAAFSPYSFLDDTTEFKAIRRIKVRIDMSSTGPATEAGSISSSYQLFEQQLNISSLFETAEYPSGEYVTDYQREPYFKVTPLEHDQLQKSENAPVPPVLFSTYPEGGTLVSGIKSKVAFRAVTQEGVPADIEGDLYEDNNPVLRFESTHEGMGSFSFVPLAGKKYHIKLSDPAVDSIIYLPEILSAGTTISLIESDRESMFFRFSRSRGLAEEEYYIRVQCRGVVYGMALATLGRESRIRLPLAGLPQGIAGVTLFNSKLEPVAERLVYINHHKKLYITSELSADVYPLRGKATLKIKVKDENGQPVVANLGVTVFDKLYENPADSLNILSHFYLSTQLKGSIYNPSAYFNGNRKGQEEELDLILLTYGRDNHVWSELNLSKASSVPRQVIYDEIRGNLSATTGILGMKKVPDDEVYLRTYSPNKGNDFHILLVDSVGDFAVPAGLQKTWEGDYVYIKPFGPPKSQLTVKLIDPFEIINRVMRPNRIVYPQPAVIKAKEVPPLLFDYKVITVPEATIRGHRTDIIRGKYKIGRAHV